MTIPDKNLITDQAKVSEYSAKGSQQEKTCQVAERTFSIGGEITVTEKYNDQLKGQHVSDKKSQGASQSRSRTQLLSNCGGKADVPQTYQACAVTPSCCQPKPYCSI